MPRKDVQVAFEREPDAERLLMREDLSEDVIEERVRSQGYQVDEVGRGVIAQLE